MGCDTRAADPLPTDEWVWGRERILWGSSPSHLYTVKVLEPKQGRAGCLSLQYHNHKSESWIVWQGVAWILLFLEDKVCTKVLRRGDGQNLGQGVVHRVMAVSSDLKILEPSTPDRHSADKSQPKDVIRLHCVHGRPVLPGRTETERALVSEAIQITEAAILAVERGLIPDEIHPEIIVRNGGFAL